MHRRGGELGQQGRAAGVRAEAELILGEGVRIGARGIRAVAQLLVVGRGTRARQQEHRQYRDRPSHVFFFFLSLLAPAAATRKEGRSRTMIWKCSCASSARPASSSIRPSL